MSRPAWGSGVWVVCLLGLAVPAGCSWLPPPAPPQPPPSGVPGTYSYVCPGGYRFTVQVYPGGATIVLPDRTVELQQVEAASGVRYGGDGVLFWTRGTEAMLRMHLEAHQGCREAAAVGLGETSLLRAGVG